MTIAIVGGGWFGCHLASVLDDRGIPVELFEQSPRLFEGASGANQNRLHLGFHYPRSHITREQSRIGFAQFIEAYPQLSAPIEKNIYAVCSRDSITDFETYRQIMASAGLKFADCNPADYGLENVDGAIMCDERVILTDKARNHFTHRLRNVLRLGQRFDDTSKHEWVINCTYQGWRPEIQRLRYDHCITLIYSSESRNAITLMDGNFFSIYPYKDDLMTLYSVKWSPFVWAENYHQAQDYRASFACVAAVRKNAEAEIGHWYPAFHDLYRFRGYYSGVRAVKSDASHVRACEVVQRDNVIHVLSGKIDSIFYAEREVLKCLGCS